MTSESLESTEPPTSGQVVEFYFSREIKIELSGFTGMKMIPIGLDVVSKFIVTMMGVDIVMVVTYLRGNTLC